MEKLKQYKYIIIIILIILGFIFYWYSYRPAKIRKLCASDTSHRSLAEIRIVSESMYVRCLRENGLEK